jgi:hypothetical protein
VRTGWTQWVDRSHAWRNAALAVRAANGGAWRWRVWARQPVAGGPVRVPAHFEPSSPIGPIWCDIGVLTALSFGRTFIDNAVMKHGSPVDDWPHVRERRFVQH